MGKSLGGLGRLFREWNAFGLEDRFRFLLQDFGVIRAPPVRAQILADLVPKGAYQFSTASGNSPAGIRPHD
jgi:hypothetical protein